MNQNNGVSEYRSIGVMQQWLAAPLLLHHSITPSLHHSISR
jgi:hypothetical protein